MGVDCALIASSSSSDGMQRINMFLVLRSCVAQSIAVKPTNSPHCPLLGFCIALLHARNSISRRSAWIVLWIVVVSREGESRVFGTTPD